MPSIVAEPATGAPCPRAAITVGGLSAGDQVITIWRTSDGERSAVRGARTITVIDSHYIEDYEAPLARDVTYELEVVSGADAGVQGLTSTILIPSTLGYIQDPLNPLTAVPVAASQQRGAVTLKSGTFATVSYDSEISTFQVLGAARPVAIGGTRQAPKSMPLSMLARGEAENVRIRELVQSSPFLVIRGLPSWGSRVPGTATYAASKVAESNTRAGDQRTKWETTGDVVRGSSARVVVALWTYQEVAQLVATYEQKQAAAGGGSYLDDQKNPSGI